MSLLGSLFKRAPAPLVGLDISSSAIKLVELSQDKHGTWVLERFASEPLEAGWVVDGAIENFEPVAQALKRLLKKSRTHAKHAALALAHASVITKRVVFPGSLSEQELEMHVESEASQYLPFSLDEVSLDFCIMGPNAKNDSDVDVMLVATRKEKVEERNDVAILAGLTPVVMDVESYACRLAASRWMDSLPKTEVSPLIALIKLGARNFSLQVVRDDEIVYDVEQAGSGAQLTQLIAREYDITPEEAERMKRTGEPLANYETRVLYPFIATLAHEVGRALQFFFSSTPYRSIQNIAIYGGTACVPGVAQAIQKQTQVPVTVLNPFDGMQLASSVNTHALEREAPMYLTACGLAMRRYVR